MLLVLVIWFYNCFCIGCFFLIVDFINNVFFVFENYGEIGRFYNEEVNGNIDKFYSFL